MFSALNRVRATHYDEGMANFFKAVFWALFGVVAGFIAAHFVNQSPKGRAFFQETDARVRDFVTAFNEGYSERDAELRKPAP